MIRFTRATIFLALFTCTLIAASQEQQPQQQDQPQSQQPAQPQHRAHSRAATPRKEDDSTAQEPPANPRADVIRENNFGVSLMNRQQFEKALGKFQRACILDPQTDVGCLNSGIAFLNMQRFDEARAILQKSAERDPRNPWAWFNLGLMEKAGGDADAAIADFQKVAVLDPYDADTQYFLGLIYSQQQQYEKAIAAFQRALVLNPFQVSAEFGMAQALQRSGKTAEAKTHFDRFLHMTSQKLGKAGKLHLRRTRKIFPRRSHAARARASAASDASPFRQRNASRQLAELRRNTRRKRSSARRSRHHAIRSRHRNAPHTKIPRPKGCSGESGDFPGAFHGKWCMHH